MNLCYILQMNTYMRMTNNGLIDYSGSWTSGYPLPLEGGAGGIARTSVVGVLLRRLISQLFFIGLSPARLHTLW